MSGGRRKRMSIEQQMSLSEQLLECRSKVAQMAVELKAARAEIKRLEEEIEKLEEQL